MNSLLVVNSSGRITRSVTRKLTERFVAGWKLRIPNGEIITRDVGLSPPPPVDESWIGAAFADNSSLMPIGPLALSEALIEELIRADAVVPGRAHV